MMLKWMVGQAFTFFSHQGVFCCVLVYQHSHLNTSFISSVSTMLDCLSMLSPFLYHLTEMGLHVLCHWLITRAPKGQSHPSVFLPHFCPLRALAHPPCTLSLLSIYVPPSAVCHAHLRHMGGSCRHPLSRLSMYALAFSGCHGYPVNQWRHTGPHHRRNSWWYLWSRQDMVSWPWCLASIHWPAQSLMMSWRQTLGLAAT